MTLVRWPSLLLALAGFLSGIGSAFAQPAPCASDPNLYVEQYQQAAATGNDSYAIAESTTQPSDRRRYFQTAVGSFEEARQALVDSERCGVFSASDPTYQQALQGVLEGLGASYANVDRCTDAEAVHGELTASTAREWVGGHVDACRAREAEAAGRDRPEPSFLDEHPVSVALGSATLVFGSASLISWGIYIRNRNYFDRVWEPCTQCTEEQIEDARQTLETHQTWNHVGAVTTGVFAVATVVAFLLEGGDEASPERAWRLTGDGFAVSF